MLWWAETDLAVKPWLISIVSNLVHLFIPHGDGLPVAQPFWRLMVVSPLGTSFVLDVLVRK